MLARRSFREKRCNGCPQSRVRAHQRHAFLSDQRALRIATRSHPLIGVAHRQRTVLGSWSNGCARRPARVCMGCSQRIGERSLVAVMVVVLVLAVHVRPFDLEPCRLRGVEWLVVVLLEQTVEPLHRKPRRNGVVVGYPPIAE